MRGVSRQWKGRGIRCENRRKREAVSVGAYSVGSGKGSRAGWVVWSGWCAVEWGPLQVSELPGSSIYHMLTYILYNNIFVFRIYSAFSLQQDLPIFPSVGKLLDTTVSCLCNPNTHIWRARTSGLRMNISGSLIHITMGTKHFENLLECFW